MLVLPNGMYGGALSTPCGCGRSLSESLSEVLRISLADVTLLEKAWKRDDRRNVMPDENGTCAKTKEGIMKDSKEDEEGDLERSPSQKADRKEQDGRCSRVGTGQAVPPSHLWGRDRIPPNRR
jgi:hypothetical protein